MSNICCCNYCYRNKYCGGNNWYSDMCTKDRSKCQHVRTNCDRCKILKELGDTDAKRESK